MYISETQKQFLVGGKLRRRLAASPGFACDKVLTPCAVQINENETPQAHTKISLQKAEDMRAVTGYIKRVTVR